MGCVQNLLFVLALVLFAFDSVLSKETCTLDDSNCLTNVAKRTHNQFVAGIPGLAEPIDPLFFENINGSVEALFNYHLKNVTLFGMRDCEVTLLKFDINNYTYEYDLDCPLLVFDFEYKSKGKFLTLEFDIEGEATITAEKYKLMINGKAEKIVSQEDKKERLGLLDYKVNTDLKGKVVYKNRRFTKGDKLQIEGAAAYLNSNQEKFENYVRTIFLEKFVELLMMRIDTFLRRIPLDQVLLKD